MTKESNWRLFNFYSSVIIKSRHNMSEQTVSSHTDINVNRVMGSCVKK